MPHGNDLHVMVLPATRRDGIVATAILRRAKIECVSVHDVAALALALESSVGALIIADTALAAPGFGRVIEALASQPAWSDVPVVLMSRANEVSGVESVLAVAARLTNVTIIDRPTSVRTLVSAVEAALRARRRQYQIRDQLIELQQAQDALRAADRRKDEFLATLAHELRNPLAPLRSALQVMELQGTQDTQDTQHERLLAMMRRQMNVMVRLIDDLLDVARISSGKVTLQRQRLDLREVVHVAVEAASPAIEAARHRLRVLQPNEPAWVMGDATRLAQVIGNLLNNATKYTPPGGELELLLRLETETAVVEVKDNGAGIPAAVLRQVFDMFAQVNRTLDRAQGGLGIGLSLVQGLLEMHGGAIEANSGGIDQGSTFTVRLPRLIEIGQDERVGAAPASDSGGSGRRLRVLVVDDNRDAADTLALLLQAFGHEVTTAYDGPQALTVADSLRPQVVFCDVGMPGMNGHEVASRLRMHPAYATSALVAVTGWGTDDDKRKAREAGFDFHLTKPADPQAIQAVLARL